MDPEVAASAATTVVKALTMTAWEQAKKAIGSRWRKAYLDRADAHEHLVQAGHAGDEHTVEDLVIEWRSRLGRLLAADPVAGHRQRAVSTSFASSVPDAASTPHSPPAVAFSLRNAAFSASSSTTRASSPSKRASSRSNDAPSGTTTPKIIPGRPSPPTTRDQPT